MKDYKGDKISPKPTFKINFGKKIIHECPKSYCDWENVNDALNCYHFFDKGYLPEVYDSLTNKPLSILDQTEFFHKSISLVAKIKNKAEEKAMESIKNGTKNRRK